MISVDHIRMALGDRRAILADAPQAAPAAVAVILRQNGGSIELLFIERARRSSDPWSGHLAFPGGRIEPTDASARAAAERETIEEVGIDLERAELLGRLDDLSASTLPVTVAAFAYLLTEQQPIRLNHEVADAFWVPIDVILDQRRHTHFSFHYRGASHRHPAIDLLGEPRPMLWGITYRFVVHLCSILNLSTSDDQQRPSE